MRHNENTAILTPMVTLVPYDSRHVPRYHEWMSDPKIQEATASEPLSLEEEYENQESWRASHDKLTFILCQPVSADADGSVEESICGDDGNAKIAVSSGKVDAADRMIGDINFFLYPDNEDEDEDARGADSARQQQNKKLCVGEVDIMIAGEYDRRKGLGLAAVTAFLHYIWSNLDAILAEYASDIEDKDNGAGLELKLLMAKIKTTNAGSIALFKRLGFEQEGEVNYFGELKMVLKDFKGIARRFDGYRTAEYCRKAE
ncbi:GNAT domain-domain-containing protein [Coniella lustricola]|uniref:GNAT domain-domain-containing protein n=1 Tax=Coniella lustricola TaxID=2025994 RepID=A0A2T3AC62_9PEZI|nr:GNAT domain-domain-containing protein [Coniella lustricola]